VQWTAHEFPNTEKYCEQGIPRFSETGSGTFHMTQQVTISGICTKLVFTNSCWVLGVVVLGDFFQKRDFLVSDRFVIGLF